MVNAGSGENEYTFGTAMIALTAFGATVCASTSASREAEFEALECDTVEQKEADLF